MRITLTGAGADGEIGTGDDFTKVRFTNRKGMYSFKNLDGGDYKVTFVQPKGFDFTTPNVGDDSSDSDADPRTGM